MLGAVIALATMAAGAVDGSTAPGPAAEVLREYEAAKAKAGRDAGSQVRLALWCEANGLSAERIRHLVLAVVLNPADGAARGLLGFVAYQGTWKRPEAIEEAVGRDEALGAALGEYNARRLAIKNKAEDHWRLALWCEEHGLKPEAIAHLTTVVRLDPRRAAAWKRLGYRQHGGRWATDEQLAAEKAEREEQKKAEKHWRPILTRWRNALSHPGQRREAEEALALVGDPRAVPVVWSVFGRGTASERLKAVQILGQIDAPGASRALALMAISKDFPEARGRAVETLRRRDPREYAGLLIGLLRDPIKYRVEPVKGAGSTGVLHVEGKESNLQRRYTAQGLPPVPFQPGDKWTTDADGFAVLLRPEWSTWQTIDVNGLYSNFDAVIQRGHEISKHGFPGLSPQTSKLLGDSVSAVEEGDKTLLNVLMSGAPPGYRLEQEYTQNLAIPVGRMMHAAQQSAAMAQGRLDADVRDLEARKMEVDGVNERVSDVLTSATGEDFGADRKGWSVWLADLRGYAITSEDETPGPTLIEDVPLAAVDVPMPAQVATAGALRLAHSCFGKGTSVQTMTGAVPIERIRVGDRALVQDTSTGSLRYEPVVAVYHNPPNRTLRLKLDGEDDIVVTGIHRVWKAGKGWVMARELRPGDLVRTLGGSRRVISVDDDEAQPVFNLEVASGQSFFVGRGGVLVHDNSVVEPVLKPFDAASGLVLETAKTSAASR